MKAIPQQHLSSEDLRIAYLTEKVTRILRKKYRGKKLASARKQLATLR